jgi:streptogramin lyase
VVTEFSAGITSSSTPFILTAGPDGNVWFTEYTGNRIGRITPSGVVTEFSAGITAGSGPVGIVLGPGGNLWFTESSGQRIGRITPAGVVTEFSAGITPLSYPQGITAGADGNLWFTENNVSKIGRITPTGTVTEFPLSPNSGPLWIATGPDGNVWFSEYDSTRQIGRITPTGVVTEFLAGTTPNSYPTGIVAGPDGGMWFTESAVDTIGRITAVEPVVPPVPAASPGGCRTAGVTTISPASGPVGAEVSILGSGFGCATGVLFGDTPALGFSIDSGGHITARAPDHVAGTVDVRVVTTAGASATSSGDAFTFTGAAAAAESPEAALVPPLIANAPAQARVATCRQMPRLIGRTLAQAQRRLVRADCSVRVTVTGRHARRGHRTITSQTPKAGRSLYAGDRAPTVRFG